MLIFYYTKYRYLLEMNINGNIFLEKILENIKGTKENVTVSNLN